MRTENGYHSKLCLRIPWSQRNDPIVDNHPSNRGSLSSHTPVPNILRLVQMYRCLALNCAECNHLTMAVVIWSGSAVHEAVADHSPSVSSSSAGQPVNQSSPQNVTVLRRVLTAENNLLCMIVELISPHIIDDYGPGVEAHRKRGKKAITTTFLRILNAAVRLQSPSHWQWERLLMFNVSGPHLSSKSKAAR
jgi:hypothetical protein